MAFVIAERNSLGGSLGIGGILSLVMVSDSKGNLLQQEPLADEFLTGWSPDGKALVCSRDGRFLLISLSGEKLKEGRQGQSTRFATRVHYHPALGGMFWLDREAGDLIVRGENNRVLNRFTGLGFASHSTLSSNGTYLACTHNKKLIILNLHTSKWVNLGPVTIHPDKEWDLLRPTWNPWLRDESGLVFISGTQLIFATPDGSTCQKICEVPPHSGLATVSPDGTKAAYVVFRESPRKNRPDIRFWGNARVWVVSLKPNSKPFPVTEPNPDSVHCLRWLNNHEIIFDRFAEVPRFPNIVTRLWKASIPAE